MTHSPHRSQGGKGAASGEKKEAMGEEMAKFKDLAKRLLGVSKDELVKEIKNKKVEKA
jgi:hypothetical protein